MDARKRNRNRIPPLSLIPGEVVGHSPQDALRVEARESQHRLLSFVHTAADVIRESVDF